MFFPRNSGISKNVQYLYLFLIGIAFNQNSFSQSSNYWAWNFNTLSILKGGTVVGGGADASAIYFNPALISQDEGPSLTLSAKLLSIQFFNAENLAGDGIDLKKTAVKVQPSFISYNFPGKNDRLNLEVSVLSPVSEDINYTLQHFHDDDIIHRTEGIETYSGYLQYSRKYDDIYLGLGASYEINDKLTIGASTFVSVKLMQYEYRQLASAFQESDSVIADGFMEPKYIAESSFEEALEYWDVSLVVKLGAHYSLLEDRLGFGVNLTLPNLPFFGSATVRKSALRSDVYDNSLDQFTANNIFIEVESDAKTRIKSPFSAAIGMQYLIPSRKNAISFSLEYFHQIDLYDLYSSDFQPTQIPDPWSGTIDPAKLMTYSHEASSVINIGIGFNQYISPKFQILGGFRTDFTNETSDPARTSQDAPEVKQIHLNKYHVTLGPVMRFRNIQLITGIQYSFAHNKGMPQIVNYSDPIEYNPDTNQSLVGTRTNSASIGLNAISLFFGLTIEGD